MHFFSTQLNSTLSLFKVVLHLTCCTQIWQEKPFQIHFVSKTMVNDQIAVGSMNNVRRRVDVNCDFEPFSEVFEVNLYAIFAGFCNQHQNVSQYKHLESFPSTRHKSSSIRSFLFLNCSIRCLSQSAVELAPRKPKLKRKSLLSYCTRCPL